MAYAMVAAIALYLARGIGEMTVNYDFSWRSKARRYHAQAWTLIAGVLLVLAVLNP